MFANALWTVIQVKSGDRKYQQHQSHYRRVEQFNGLVNESNKRIEVGAFVQMLDKIGPPTLDEQHLAGLAIKLNAPVVVSKDALHNAFLGANVEAV